MAGSEHPELTHLDSSGQAHMVDVLAKEITRRRAVAKCCIEMDPTTAAVIGSGDLIKALLLGLMWLGKAAFIIQTLIQINQDLIRSPI